jgi:hypothetical protein
MKAFDSALFVSNALFVHWFLRLVGTIRSLCSLSAITTHWGLVWTENLGFPYFVLVKAFDLYSRTESFAPLDWWTGLASAMSTKIKSLCIQTRCKGAFRRNCTHRHQLCASTNAARTNTRTAHNLQSRGTDTDERHTVPWTASIVGNVSCVSLVFTSDSSGTRGS